jgi:hypothetical protein
MANKSNEGDVADGAYGGNNLLRSWLLLNGKRLIL